MHKEKSTDLFSTEYSYALVHFVSSDGIINTELNRKFKERFSNELFKKIKKEKPKIGSVVTYHNKGKMIFNLVIKKRYYDKTTYNKIEYTLIELKNKCLDLNIKGSSEYIVELLF